MFDYLSVTKVKMFARKQVFVLVVGFRMETSEVKMYKVWSVKLVV